jgi:hypothetical protein
MCQLRTNAAQVRRHARQLRILVSFLYTYFAKPEDVDERNFVSRV